MIENTIIYLIGFPGVGKYTTAKALCALDSNIKLVDNHLINNPVFSLIKKDGGSTIPEAVWELIRPIRALVLKTIRTQSPKYFSFVFTNNLYDDEEDKALYAQIEDLAKDRGAKFVPVILICDLNEHKNRIGNEDRAVRHKQTCAETLERELAAYKIIELDNPNTLNIDTTNSAPAQTAQAIYDHVKGLN